MRVTIPRNHYKIIKIVKQAEAQAYNLSQQPDPHGPFAYKINIATSENWWISTGPGGAWHGTSMARRPGPPDVISYDLTISHGKRWGRSGQG